MEGFGGLYFMHEVYIVPKEAAHNNHPLPMWNKSPTSWSARKNTALRIRII